MKSLNDLRNNFNVKLQSVSPEWHSALLFKGVIDLIITPPFDVVSYLQLLRYLKNNRRFRILSTCGSFEEESISSIKILILEPYSVFDLVIDIPGIQDARVLTGDELISISPTDFIEFETYGESDQKCQILLSFSMPAPKSY
jgi:hypothetical protein